MLNITRKKGDLMQDKFFYVNVFITNILKTTPLPLSEIIGLFNEGELPNT